MNNIKTVSLSALAFALFLPTTLLARFKETLHPLGRKIKKVQRLHKKFVEKKKRSLDK